MNKKILFIIDPLVGLCWERDTSLMLAYNAQISDNNIYYCLMNQIFIINGEVICHAHSFEINYDNKTCIQSPLSETFNLNNFQIILIRLNPPFNMTYLTMTHLLDLVDQTKTLIINSPRSFQNNSEKILAMKFSEFTPETIVTNNFNEIENFAIKHGKIILKPLYSFSSNDVFLLKEQDPNIQFIFENLIEKYNNCPVIAQKFIPNIIKGDKRILIIDGEILGSFLRIPKPGSILAGMHYGSSAQLSELTEKETLIVSTIKDFLRQEKLYFVGIDTIDDYLTEINFTSPTGLPVLSKLTGIDYGKKAWQMFENIYQKEILFYKG